MGQTIVEGSLTGHRRYRRQELHGLSGAASLVLQVCYNTWVPASETKPEGHWRPMWRDATPEDVTGVELYGGT